jgi:archaellum component FlaC
VKRAMKVITSTLEDIQELVDEISDDVWDGNLDAASAQIQTLKDEVSTLERRLKEAQGK